MSDFISIRNDSGLSEISFTKNGSTLLDINGFLLGDHLNIVEMKVHTAGGSANGIIASIEEVTDSLFIPDGRYGLWTRAEAMKQGMSPFFMAKS